MTSQQKIAVIESQMVGVSRGKLGGIDCPYCGNHNRRPSALDIDQEPQPMCCETFAVAVNAVIDKMLTGDQIDSAARIADRAAAAGVMN